ncbi:hypothetical protein F4813DRAFT_393727 [Daldinia decipiens]|uniref:uncharacterized protein n=1 Tax=Daldinia decipiens TaxID=326647 RepID=UPI0020C41B44|nr:uncharacterized protein F4813DRAFT_393727 [Daldinia decipiens]KAI1653412.1 hypothetical protein F4813DRAFT_393727 [Daldinia decipiens]
MDSLTSEVQTESRAARKPQRTRVLRTYGKRISTNEPLQPTPKRRCIENINTATISNNEEIESPCNTNIPSSPVLPTIRPMRKGTIMSYFKVVSSSSSSCALNSSNPSSEPVDPINTPPSSPPIRTLPRKNRRKLTTRITSRAASEESNTEGTTKKDGEEERNDGVDIGSMLSTDSPHTLSEVSSATLNLPATEQNIQPDTKKREWSIKKVSKPATVQTTLSLSIEDKGFIECNECNMLYNPLHKQDAKCHARRHAAMLKAKSSIYDNNEILD